MQISDQEIFEKVRDIVVLCMPELKKEEITMDSVINRDMGVDSMNFVMILCKVEAAFDIRVPDEDWPKLASMQDVISEVKKLIIAKEVETETVQQAAQSDGIKIRKAGTATGSSLHDRK